MGRRSAFAVLLLVVACSDSASTEGNGGDMDGGGGTGGSGARADAGSEPSDGGGSASDAAATDSTDSGTSAPTSDSGADAVDGGADAGGSDAATDAGGATDGGGATDAGTDAATASIDSTSMAVTAADGATIELQGGTLELLPGALSADTTITVDVREVSASTPDAGSIQGYIYDFGPDGTSLPFPAVVRLPANGAPGAGEIKVIAYLEGDRWIKLPSFLIGDEVVAAVGHFTPFAVFLMAEAAYTDCEFTPCGGDPTGEWLAEAVCTGLGVVDNSYCAGTGGLFVQTPAPQGRLSLRADGTFGWSVDMKGGGMTWWPPACMDAADAVQLFPSGTGAPATDCSVLAYGIHSVLLQGQGNTQCTGSRADGCFCVDAVPGSQAGDTGTWTVNGNNIAFTGGNGTYERPFCVDGTVLHDDRRPTYLSVLTWIAEP